MQQLNGDARAVASVSILGQVSWGCFAACAVVKQQGATDLRL
jgi:hypothetical protein